MKNFWLILMVALLAVGLVFVGCDNGNTRPPPPPPLPQLTGTITISPTSAFVGEELTATYSGDETVTYQWRRGSTNVGTDSDKFTPETAGNYTVTVSAAGFQSKTSTAVPVIEEGQTLPSFPIILFENGAWLAELGTITEDGDPITGAPGAGTEILWENPIDITGAVKFVLTGTGMDQWWYGGIFYFVNEDDEINDGDPLEIQWWDGGGGVTLQEYIFADFEAEGDGGAYTDEDIDWAKFIGFALQSGGVITKIEVVGE